MPKNSEQIAHLDENGDIVYGYDPEASAGFTLLNPGFYRGVIEDCPVRVKQKDGRPVPDAVPYLALRVRVDPAPGKERGRVLFENVSFKAEWKIAQLQDAVYGKDAAGQRRLNPAELQGAAITFYVAQTKSNRTNVQDPSGLDNSIARFVSLEEADEVELYDYAAELAAAEEEEHNRGWGYAADEEEAGPPSSEEAEAAYNAALAEMAAEEVPFDDEPEPAPAPAARRPAPPARRPAPASKKAAAKKTARRK
jgi:hypothetical protein